MATTNHDLATRFGAKAPHTLNALQHLVMAMADCQSSKGKRSLFFGYDKEIRALRKFEDRLKDSMIALVADDLIERRATPDQFCAALIETLAIFEKTYPNWTDAYQFAREWFGDKTAALRKVAQLLP